MWTLVIIIYALGNGVAVTNITGFSSEQQCKQESSKIKVDGVYPDKYCLYTPLH